MKIPKTKYQKPNTKSGFTFIEALALLFIFSVITLTFYQVMAHGTADINYSKDQLGALAVANEKMEIVRNLDYSDVGATGEAVGGSLPQDENVTENGRTYHVHTLIAYVDDPLDGTFPNDTIPEDYKLVKITVSWNDGGSNQGNVSLTSRFVPPGLETTDPNTGILSINILGSDGAAVSGAAVHIVNPDVGIDETLDTDANGNATLVGAKAALQDYEITVSKDGYETVATLPPYPTTPYYPTDVYQSVMAGALTTATLTEDKTANLTIKTIDQSGNPVPNVGFTLVGGRVLGKQATAPNAPVYNLNVNDQTDSNGQKEYTAISPGKQFTFTPTSIPSGYELVGSEPVSPFSLLAGQSLNFKAELASTSVISVLVKVTDSVSAAAVSGASVELSNATGYDETLTTDGNGTAYFPAAGDTTPFAAGDYTLKVSANNYQTDTETVTVSSGSLLNKTVTLTSS